jgi:hypothetical protein
MASRDVLEPELKKPTVRDGESPSMGMLQMFSSPSFGPWDHVLKVLEMNGCPTQLIGDEQAAPDKSRDPESE